eukprot:GFYU01005984.1.p1 GENE.GFYU01005984.1~~GFYU01005984.1.p1  ORF type:complete len:337 (-),score=77.79 GFYU01005984.1:102-1112(-)
MLIQTLSRTLQRSSAGHYAQATSGFAMVSRITTIRPTPYYQRASNHVAKRFFKNSTEPKLAGIQTAVQREAGSPCWNEMEHKQNKTYSTDNNGVWNSDDIDYVEDRDIVNVLRENRKWVDKMKQDDPDFFVKMGEGQAPPYLYIGCSDSRIPANEIMGLRAGDVFVHRNVANLVVASDMNLLSVIEFAIGVLGVKHICLVGHYDCGGVKASLKVQDHGLIEHWVRNIRDVHRLHHDTLDAIEDPDQRLRKLVELNVVEQCLNLYKLGIIQKKRLETYNDPECKYAYPRIHGLVFDPATGLLNKLKLDFKSQIQQYQHIYDLYDVRQDDEKDPEESA